MLHRKDGCPYFVHLIHTTELLLRYPPNIRHISPLMFDVIYDKPEGLARGIYHV